jgi:selenocysteine lyase/cysteine desulfurase
MIGEMYGKNYEAHFPGFSGRRLHIRMGITVLREYDHVLSAVILDELETMPGVQIHGITDRTRLEELVPTVSFTWEGQHPRRIAAALGEQGIFVWDGNYYALAVTTRLGLEGRGGMVRIGAVHYNTVEEIQRLGEALQRIESQPFQRMLRVLVLLCPTWYLMRTWWRAISYENR